MAIRSLLKKASAVYAAKKSFDTIQRARRPEPRRSSGGKLGRATVVALVGGAGIFLARSGRLQAIPGILRRKTSLGLDSASNGDGQFTASSTLVDRPT